MLDLDITIDKTGFPMVHLPEMKVMVSWLPFTKIQLEHFIADTNTPDFDQAKYDKIASYNHRISPAQMDIGRYEGVFLTGILPSEARLIAQWLGVDYDLPMAAEWKSIFTFVYQHEASQDIIEHISSLERLSERAKRLISRLDVLSAKEEHQLLGDTRRVSDQMLMRMGIMEYVYENNYRNSFAGQGMPNRAFHPHTRSLPRDGQENLRDELREKGGRIKQYGFRLIRRK